MERILDNRRFLSWLGLIFLAICTITAGFNYAVDPYALFNTPRIEGFNARKPAAADHIRTSKPYMATAAKARTVIAGNSRPELGLDSLSPCWTNDDKPVFNTAIPGADLYMQTQYAKHALSAGQGRKVLLGLDLNDFLEDTRHLVRHPDWLQRSSTYAGRLNIPGEKTPLTARFSLQAKDKLGALLSLNTLSDSILTVASQSNLNTSDRRADGFNPARDYLEIIRREGQYVLFAQKNKELVASLTRKHLGLYNMGNRDSENYAALRDFLTWTRANNIETILFINPYHSDYLQSIAKSGMWKTLEQWKRDLTVIASEFGVSLWDFNAVDMYSTETPPVENDRRRQLEWYWEPAHYKRELGELVLSQLVQRSCDTATTHRPGVRLTEAIIDAHLDTLRTSIDLILANRLPSENAK